MAGLPAELIGLLASCRECPADDTPRLVLADWLEEHGESVPDAAARASLIRVQVELSRPSVDVAYMNTLRQRECQLIVGNWKRWVGDLPTILARIRGIQEQSFLKNLLPNSTQDVINPLARWNPWGFRRGMLWMNLRSDEIANDLVQAWFASDLAPWVEMATVPVDNVRELTQLEVTPALVPYLGVGYTVGGTPVMTLQNPRPPRGAMSENRCRQLLKCKNFRLVRSLKVMADAVEVGFVGLMKGADVRNLRYLDLRDARLTDKRTVELAAAPLESLSSLDISGNGIGPKGIAALASSPHLKRLVMLTAFRNQFGDSGLEALTQSPLAESLQSLSLQNNAIGGRGVKMLCESPLVARLVGPGLNLSMNRIDNTGAKALAECEPLGHFRELILRENRIGPAGAKALAESPHVANLTYLDLYQNKIGDGGAKALAESESLSLLRDLSLRDNGITAKGTQALQTRYGERVKA